MKYALRSLAKSPGFAATAILTLALGIGASTAIFSVVHAVLLTPLQYRDAGQLVQIQSRHREQGAAGLAPATFHDVAARHTAFATLAAQYYFYVNLTGTDTPALVNSAEVTPEFFTLFGVAPLRGRVWTADDIEPGASPVVVLGHALWRAQFGGRDSILGAQLMLDGVAHTVIGIMPASFKDPAETAQLWRPMLAGRDNPHERGSRYWTVFGRRNAALPLAAANAELDTIARQLAQTHPEDYKDWTLQAADLRSLVVGNYRAGLLVLLGAVGCVMLITCANLAGLAILRTVGRRKELAIRSALGSSRFQLVRHLLGESVLLSLLGGVAGLLLASWGVDALVASLPPGWLPRADEIGLNVPVLALTFAVTLTVGAVAGLSAGFTGSRADANDALKDGAHGSTASSSHRLRSGLIVAEVALALMLLAGTGLLGRSFLGILEKKPGLEASRVLSLTVSLPATRYESPNSCWDFFSRAEQEVGAVPGVEAAGFTHTSPFRWGIPFAFVPAPPNDAAAAAELPQAFLDAVSVDYFQALGIPLRAGRTFTPADDANAPARVIISELAARHYFGDENPIGRFIKHAGDTGPLEVVGVAGDVRRAGLTAAIPLQVYRPLAQRTPPFATLMVRTSLPPASLTKSIQAALWRIDPEIPVSDVATMDTYVSRSITQPRLYLALFSLFAALALGLAAIGLYGLIAHGVAQRTREFGVRTALGASPRAVLRLVMREGAVLVALGVVAGMVAALAAARLVQSLLFEISPHDPLVFLVAPIALGVVALLACVLPARRAMKVDPMVALRAE